MKPRIVIHKGVWCCFTTNWQRTRIVGMGYSPKEAYVDWREHGGSHV